MATVRIDAPNEGLEALAAHGRAAALAVTWQWSADPGGDLVGLWWSNHVALATLAGTVDDGASRVLVTLRDGDRSGARAELISAIRLGWRALASMLPGADVAVPDELSVAVERPIGEASDTGWLAAVGIVAGAGVAAWAIYRVTDVVERVLKRRIEGQQLAVDLAKLDTLAQAHVQRETVAGHSLELDPVTRAQVDMLVQRSDAVIKKQASEDAPAVSPSPIALWPWAAVVLGLVYLWRKQ